MDTTTYQPPADRPQSPLFWATAGLAVISAGVAVGVKIHASETRSLNLFELWAVAPFAAMTGVAVWLRRDRWGSAVVLVATVVTAGLTAAEIHDFQTSKSSTAALVFVTTPVLQLAGATVAAVVALKLARRASGGNAT